MGNNFTFDMTTKTETLSSISILRIIKQKSMLKFMEIETHETTLTQKQFSKQLGYSYSTIKGYRDNKKLNSPYKKNSKRKPLNQIHHFISSSNQVHAANQHTKNNKNIKKKDLKGGAFSEEQGNKPNYITIARNVLDNMYLKEWEWITDKKSWNYDTWYCWRIENIIFCKNGNKTRIITTVDLLNM